MKYFKFFGKCILAALPIIAIVLYTALCPMMYMDEEYPAWRFSKRVAEGKECVGVNFNTVILGDSVAMSSFNPKYLSDSTVNLAVGGGTTIEAYYFLKEYLENHNAPQNVIVMFAPFHYHEIDNYETRTVYFKALPISDAIEVYKSAKNNDADIIYNKDVILADIECRASLPMKYIPAITAARFAGRKSTNDSLYNELIDRRGYGTFGVSDGCDAVSYESTQSWLNMDGAAWCIGEYLGRIGGLCHENGINLLIVQPALNEATMEAMDDSYLEEHANVMGFYNMQLSEAKIESDLRCYPNEYFGDVSHLNEKGAKVFSEEMLNTYPEYFE